MKQYESVKELRIERAKHFIKYSGQEMTQENIEREAKLAAPSLAVGFISKMKFGVNADVEYIDGFGWALV